MAVKCRLWGWMMMGHGNDIYHPFWFGFAIGLSKAVSLCGF